LKAEGATPGLECSADQDPVTSATAQDPATLPSLDEQELVALEEAIRKNSDKHRQPPGQNLQKQVQIQQHTAARQKDWGLKTAIKCLRQMLKEGHPKESSLDLCNAILKCCVANFRPWIALSLLDQMNKWGVEPDQTSLNYAVQACVRVKVGFTGRAIRLLDDVSVQPMDATWVALLNACLSSPHARAWEATVAVADRAVSCKLAKVRRSHSFL
jgi:pentatricopeptide repeat protein